MGVRRGWFAMSRSLPARSLSSCFSPLSLELRTSPPHHHRQRLPSRRRLMSSWLRRGCSWTSRSSCEPSYVFRELRALALASDSRTARPCFRLVCRFVGIAFKSLGQPSVIGEIIAGALPRVARCPLFVAPPTCVQLHRTRARCWRSLLLNSSPLLYAQASFWAPPAWASNIPVPPEALG